MVTGSAVPGGQDFLSDRGCVFAVFAGYIEMGDEAYGAGGDCAGQNPGMLECGAEGLRVASAGKGEDDDIGLDGFEIDLGGGVGGDGLGEEAGVGVIFVETRGHLFEGYQARGCKDARLAHATA